ncbi:kinesin-like protein KIFC3 [Symsagittifera roscoffensis]|uniref:kinesin-like protein KIFC3 n=1 Tax=Symsagittifera roscoffensis TaxID=84072 RepID=UPI00307C227E
MELMIKGANEKVKKMDEQQNNLKDFVVKELEKLKNMLKQLAECYQLMRGGETDLGAEIEEVRALYRKEMLQRKLLYNQLQELRGNIRVFCRIKPDKSSCLTVSDESISLVNVHGKKMEFEFDKIYDQKVSQSDIFENTKPIITSAVDGYNVCIIAYGQTGSGKTFTMMGPEKDPGVNLRAVQELFSVAKTREKVTFKITAQMLEVYNEQIKDLLRDPKDPKPVDIIIRIMGKTVKIENAVETEITAPDDVKKMIKRGDVNRHTAQTKMNTNSSRSHLLLKINVEITDKVTGGRTVGSLTLVDLAGSEKIAKSGAEGQTLIEAAAINKSLSSLGQVFSALRSKSVHVPYRNSKLTQLLQPSLGGDAKACIFVNCSPLDNNSSETLSTLEFGQNARQVELGKAGQNIVAGPGKPPGAEAGPGKPPAAGAGPGKPPAAGAGPGKPPAAKK